MRKLRINPIANKDLHEIKEYITKEFDNDTEAIKVVSKIVNDYSRLTDFPLLGIELSSKIGAETNYRYLISGNFIIIYAIEGEYISIYRVLYSRRDYLNLLFDTLNIN